MTDYPHINSPEADQIIAQARRLAEDHDDLPRTFTHEEEETVLEAALILQARRRKPLTDRKEE